MNQEQINQIWVKTDILINHFKKYDLEKRIQYVAKNAVTSELLASQIKETAIRTIDEKVKEQEKKKEEEQREIIQKIQKTATNAVKNSVEVFKFANTNAMNILDTASTNVNMINSIKDTAIQAIEDKVKEQKESDENEIIENIQKSATNAVKNSVEVFKFANTNAMNILDTASSNVNIINSIKDAAIQAIEDKVKEQKESDENEIIENIQTAATNAVKKSVGLNKYVTNILDTASSNVNIINSIKDAAIREIKDNVEKQKESDENEIIENIQTVAKNTLISELMASQIKEAAIRAIEDKVKEQKQQEGNAIIENIEKAAKNAVINAVKIKNVTNNITTEIFSKALTNVNIKTLAKQIIMTFIKKHTSLIKTIIAIKKVAIAAVTDAVDPKDITELIKQTAIKEVSTSLPKVAESKKNIESLITDLAIKTVQRETTGSAKTAPGTSTGPNIENDLKNTAINALYTALLGVPREPVDISKKPDKYDVLITDKTYKYDEKGQPVEEKELTKYDRILAKELTKYDSILAK